MNLDCGAVLSRGDTPYMIVHGSADTGTPVYRNHVLINLYNGVRWSDTEFQLPITLEELNSKYSLNLKFEGYLNGKV